MRSKDAERARPDEHANGAGWTTERDSLHRGTVTE